MLDGLKLRFSIRKEFRLHDKHQAEKYRNELRITGC
jgi:hypothetical protein